MTSLPVRLALLVLAQLALVAVGVAPQLSARLAGEEYEFRVAPLDPIDPFRGAYVALAYPDLQPPTPDDPAGDPAGDPAVDPATTLEDGRSGEVYVALERDGEVWVASSFTRERPADGPYLACNDRGWNLDCGIDSWFLPQDEAAELERAVDDGQVVATVRVDSRGNAALVGVETTD